MGSCNSKKSPQLYVRETGPAGPSFSPQRYDYPHHILYPDLLTNQTNSTLIGKYEGSFEDIKDLVDLVGISGTWRKTGTKHTFVTEDDPVLSSSASSLASSISSEDSQPKQNNNKNINNSNNNSNNSNINNNSNNNNNNINNNINSDNTTTNNNNTSNNMTHDDTKYKNSNKSTQGSSQDKANPSPFIGTLSFNTESTDFALSGPKDFILKFQNVLQTEEHKEKVHFLLENNSNTNRNILAVPGPDQVLPKLFLCGLASATNLEHLKNLQISHVLAVGTGLSTPHSKLVKYLRIQVYDSPLVDLRPFFDKCYDFIEEGRTAGTGVVVHCAAGISRSSTMTIMYVMRKFHMRFKEAFQLVFSRHYCSPNSGFRIQLLEFEAQLFNKSKEDEDIALPDKPEQIQPEQKKSSTESNATESNSNSHSTEESKSDSSNPHSKIHDSKDSDLSKHSQNSSNSDDFKESKETNSN